MFYFLMFRSIARKWDAEWKMEILLLSRTRRCLRVKLNKREIPQSGSAQGGVTHQIHQSDGNLSSVIDDYLSTCWFKPSIDCCGYATRTQSARSAQINRQTVWSVYNAPRHKTRWSMYLSIQHSPRSPRVGCHLWAGCARGCGAAPPRADLVHLSFIRTARRPPPSADFHPRRFVYPSVGSSAGWSAGRGARGTAPVRCSSRHSRCDGLSSESTQHSSPEKEATQLSRVPAWRRCASKWRLAPQIIWLVCLQKRVPCRRAVQCGPAGSRPGPARPSTFCRVAPATMHQLLWMCSALLCARFAAKSLLSPSLSIPSRISPGAGSGTGSGQAALPSAHGCPILGVWQLATSRNVRL